MDLRGSELPTPELISLRSPTALRWTDPGHGDVGNPPLVEVELIATMPRSGSFIIIEDMLPGGFEALNESLSITSRELNIWGESRLEWTHNGYNYKEVRADRVDFFFTEREEETLMIKYLARNNHKGAFFLMPAQA